MELFARNLRRRAQELGLTHAEVARRAGLSERRYAHYASGRNEPDLTMLLKIAEVLQTSPGALLAGDEPEVKDERARLTDRLTAAAAVMTHADLEAAVVQAEAVVNLRRR